MRSALAYEWMRLRTIRSTYWLIGFALGLQLVLTFFIAELLPATGPLSGGTNAIASLLTLGASAGFAPLLIAYIIGIIGVFSMGHEYRHSMIRSTLTALPNRSAVFFAKVITIGIVAACVALASMGIGLVNAVIFGVRLPDATEILNLVLGVVIFTVLFTWSGFAFAALVRNQTAAVGMLMLVPSVVESIVRAVVFSIKAGSGNPGSPSGWVTFLKFLPFHAGGEMYTRASLDRVFAVFGFMPFGPLAGGVVFGVFVALLLWASYALFLRRDA